MSDAPGSPFPDGFLWGAATSAYQIEGSPLADGAGPSNWHRFAHTPGRTLNGWNGDVACDHYRRWREDVALMRTLGLGAYRFSLSWSRILPDGLGRVNPKGLDFYSRLIDALLENGIMPMATLFHWDLPAALDDLGGWLNPDARHWFADYAALVFEAFDDRVPWWCTINEPWVVVDAGYLFGVNAPGHRNLYETPIASHHLLRAHAEAVRRYRSIGRNRIGVVLNLEPKEPASARAEDLAAVERADVWMNRAFVEPLTEGRYPEALADLFGDAWPRWPEEEVDALRERCDFVGLNWYTRAITKHDPSNPPLNAARVHPPGAEITETGWEVHAPSLLRTLRWMRERFGETPILITENGAAFPDPPAAADGRVDDPRRVSYLREHLRAVSQAIREGIPVRGYFAWSLLDNFEWHSGYSKRFGLIHVDFESQRRTIKSSGHFYGDVIRSRGAVLGEEPAPEARPR
jgi:beta-glucosidase